MKRFILLILIFIIVLSPSSEVFAFDTELYSALEDAGNYLYKTVTRPQIAAIGGEWSVLGLARSDMNIPDEYFENYYQTVKKQVKASEGILHSRKYTEFSRVIIALTSIGKNPEDVAGYNLLTALSDYEKVIWQGINGAVWALIALDCGNYNIPENPEAKIQATRKMYLEYILENQTSDGGWALSGDTANPDITGMVLQALSEYQEDDKVKSATEKAVACLSEIQNENGGFNSFETENSESSVQVLVALCELGISADDERFIKAGNSLLDNLFSFYDKGNGFKHMHNDPVNLMATEQCFYALVAVKRAMEGRNTLYDMSDAEKLDISSAESGLTGKNSDVKKMSVTAPGKTFDDINGHKDKKAIEALATRGIINGKTESCFEPDSTMTRAEFATIIARGLGLPEKKKAIFGDVTPMDWFCSYVGTAYNYGIIKGISENEFNPNGTITREEAAVMVSRAAKLCGMDTEIQNGEIRDILAGFSDYVKASEWSQASLAFCFKEGILSDEAMDIKPKEAVTRAEISGMLYNMLMLSELI